jgi:hypothetical protein
LACLFTVWGAFCGRTEYIVPGPCKLYLAAGAIKLYSLIIVVDFRWNDWNREHAAKHDVSRAEAEGVVIRARRPWPRNVGGGKWMVEGRGVGDRPVRVVYLVDPDDTIYIIHAMPLTTRRRRRRR